MAEKPEDWERYPYPFIYGQADPALFDHHNWRQCALRALGRREFSALTSDQFERDDPMLIDMLRGMIGRCPSPRSRHRAVATWTQRSHRSS